MADYTWVERVETVDAVDYDVVDAMNANPGWRLIGVGVGLGGQTTLTYGWPWEGKVRAEPKEPACTFCGESLSIEEGCPCCDLNPNMCEHLPF